MQYLLENLKNLLPQSNDNEILPQSETNLPQAMLTRSRKIPCLFGWELSTIVYECFIVRRNCNISGIICRYSDPVPSLHSNPFLYGWDDS